MTHEPVELGAALRRYRLAAGLTQQAVASRAGVGVRTLRDLEQGRIRSPRARSIQALATALGLTTGERDLLLAALQEPRPRLDAPGLHVAVLGPLSVRRSGHPVEIRAPLQRTLLGLLALHPGEAVSSAETIDVLWGDDPPPTCRALVHDYIAQLRRHLEPDRPARGSARVVTRSGGGYQLDLAADQLDLSQFDRLAAQGAQARAAGDLGRAWDLFERALGSWRGPLLADAGPRLRGHPAGVAVQRRRVAAALAAADLAADLGRHERAVTLLRPLVHEEPLHEGLGARLMLALAGCGEQVAALRLFEDLRRRLGEELGVDPGAELQAAHVRVLRGGPPGAAAPVAGARRPPAPAELPATIASFTGRAGQLARLAALAEAGGAAPTTVVIAGTAGVGKTALAVHFAHRVRGRYPDGQLFVNLRGYAPTPPLRPIQALAQVLRALGLEPDTIPADLEQAAGLYRTLLAGRRVLMVLDDAAHSDQVRPLLPGGPGCLVLVTSRDRLGGLVARDDARRVDLGVLRGAESAELLARIVGDQRVAAEPEAAAELARACAHLPIALRIAAANLADQPRRPIAAYVGELRSGDRLASLAVDGDEHGAVRAAFDLSYRRLAPPARRLFRLLGLVPGPDVTAGAAAALAAVEPGEAAVQLGQLTGAHLVDQHVPGRFRLHDLLRVYAADRARSEDEEADRAAALGRLFDWYLATVHAAVRLLYPGLLRLPLPAAGPPPTPVAFGDVPHALAWLDAERPNLLDAAQHAAGHGPRPLAWLLIDALRGYFWLRVYTVDWVVAARGAFTAAEAAGDARARAAMRLTLADTEEFQSRYREAIEHYRHGLTLTRRSGWRHGEAAILGGLGFAHQQLGRLEEAVDHYTRSVELNRELGRLGPHAAILANLGAVRRDLGRLDQAAEDHARAVALAREAGSRSFETTVLAAAGATSHLLGRLDAAADELTRAVALAREVGNRRYEADALRDLAEVRRDAGRFALALRLAGQAVDLARDTGDRRCEAAALNTLGTVHRCGLNHHAALDAQRRALELARAIGAHHLEVATLVELAATNSRLGQPDQARRQASQALALAREAGYRILEGQALTTLAELALAGGDGGRAAEHARQALDLQRATGHRLGQARTLVVLGHVLRRTRGPDAAPPCWAEAAALFDQIGSPEAGELRALLDAGQAAAEVPGPAGRP